MAGRAGAGCAAAAAGGVFTFALALAILAASLGSEADASGGALRSGSVPEPFTSWVQRGGTLCPQVSAPLLAAQLETESGWNPNAVSPAGAQGIAQFMPDTWPSWATDADGDGTTSPFDPPDAIMAAARYDCALARQTSRLVADGRAAGEPADLFLAAYNAGIGRVEEYRGVPPFPETRTYVRRIRELAATKYHDVSDAAAPGALGERIVEHAMRWQGTPYVWGGGDYNGPTKGGFDCSGLVLYAVAQASTGAIRLPHRSQVQVTLGTAVPLDQIAPGDVIGWALSGPADDWDHIGIYIGQGRMVHAPKPGDVVKVSDIATDGFYAPRVRTGAITVRRYA